MYILYFKFITFSILQAQDHLLTAYGIAHIIGMSSAVSNPVLYGLLNKNFRKVTKVYIIFVCTISYIDITFCSTQGGDFTNFSEFAEFHLIPLNYRVQRLSDF